MKSLIKILLLGALLSGFNELHAGNCSTVTKIEHAGAKSIAVYMEFPVATNAYLTVRDQTGALIFSEVYRDITVFAKKIDLANLPEGSYSLEVEGPQKIHVYGVRLSADQLLIEGGKPKVIYKPAFVQRGNFMDITMLLLDEPSATVKIFAPDGELLKTQVFENTKSLQKRYDLSQLPPGTYSFVVSAGEKTFTQYLTVRLS
jgi:hypothetical protein